MPCVPQAVHRHGRNDLRGDGHYTDLIQTIGFLQDDPKRTEEFKGSLATYRRELFQFRVDASDAARAACDAVARHLRKVMVRTERLAVTPDRDGMLREIDCDGVRVHESDVNAFLAVQSVARELEVSDVTEYWNSAPYLLNFMEDYDLKRSFIAKVATGALSDRVIPSVASTTGVLLSKDEVLSYHELEPGNARLRQGVRR